MISRLLLFSRQLPLRTQHSPRAICRMASTFQLPSSPGVRVSIPHNLTQAQLLAFPAFKNWLSTLQKSLALQESQRDHEFHAQPYELQSIIVQAVDWFGGQGTKLGFVKLIADVRNGEGESLPGAVFLRGGSVAMMVSIGTFYFCHALEMGSTYTPNLQITLSMLKVLVLDTISCCLAVCYICLCATGYRTAVKCYVQQTYCCKESNC